MCEALVVHIHCCRDGENGCKPVCNLSFFRVDSGHGILSI